MTVLKRNFFMGTSFFCAAYLVFSSQLSPGDIANPGPGFVPMLFGTIGLVLSLILTVAAFRVKTEAPETKGGKTGLLRFWLYILISFAFLALFPTLGTILSVGLLVFLLSKVSGEDGWIKPLLLGAGCAFAFYLLFSKLLQVPLPQGIVTFI